MMKNNDFIQQETITGVVPMLKKDRQYNFIDLFLTTSGFAIATWCYTQGAAVAGSLSFKQMLINIFAFNIFWVFIECLPVIFAVRYGIDLWIWLRSVLGRKGVAVLATVISFANFGWYAVAANLFSSSMINLVKGFGVQVNETVWGPILGVLCVVLGTLIALGGPSVIKWTNRFLVTALLGVGIVAVIICLTSVDISKIIQFTPVTDSSTTPLQAFMASGEANIAFAFSWSTQALVLPRLAKTERGGYWGTSISYGIVAPFFVVAGAVIAIAYYITTNDANAFSTVDFTAMIARLCGPAFSLVSLLLVAFANVGTQGTGSYVNCMIIKSGAPKLKYKVLVLIAMVYVSFLTVSGLVRDNFLAFISIAAFIQAPIIGMSVVDYLIVKRRKISLRAAYELDGHDAYKFTKGFNLVGIAVVIISCLITVLFVYNPATCEAKSKLFYIFTGSGFDCILGGVLYWIASITPLKKYMLRDRNDIEII